MGGVCYQRYHERGLWFERKCIKDVIASKKKRGLDASFEKKILKAYQKYSEADYANRPEIV